MNTLVLFKHWNTSTDSSNVPAMWPGSAHVDKRTYVSPSAQYQGSIQLFHLKAVLQTLSFHDTTRLNGFI